jgi:exosome complex component RRP42
MNIEYYLKKDYMTSILQEGGKRIDGRGPDDFRQLSIEKGYVSQKACGSAYVKLGDTEVLTGVSMLLGEPYPDSPNSGVMSTSTEFRPIASPYFESGPPREDSIEVSRVVDRGIRESKCIDFDKLFIEEGRIWALFLDIHILNHAGNLIDAGGISAIAALTDTKMPKVEDGRIVGGEWAGKLELERVPVPFTFHKIGDNIILDPTSDEEYATDARLTVTTSDTLNAMQKGGTGAFTPDEVRECVAKAFKKAPEMRKIIEE